MALNLTTELLKYPFVCIWCWFVNLATRIKNTTFIVDLIKTRYTYRPSISTVRTWTHSTQSRIHHSTARTLTDLKYALNHTEVCLCSFVWMTNYIENISWIYYIVVEEIPMQYKSFFTLWNNLASADQCYADSKLLKPHKLHNINFFYIHYITLHQIHNSFYIFTILIVYIIHKM